MFVRKEFLLLLVVVDLFAATYTVTNNYDSGEGSFREAVSSLSSGDTIDFDVDLSTSYEGIYLDSDLEIPVHCTIDGSNDGRGTLISSYNKLILASDVQVTITGALSQFTLEMDITEAGGPAGFTKNGEIAFELNNGEFLWIPGTTGSFYCNEGTLMVRGISPLGTGALFMADGTTLQLQEISNLPNAITLSGDVTFFQGSDEGTIVYPIDGNISGSGNLTLQANDPTNGLIFSGENTFSGTMHLEGMQLYLTGKNSQMSKVTLQDSAGLIITDNGAFGDTPLEFFESTTLQLGRGVRLGSEITIDAAAAATVDVPLGAATLSGTINNSSGTLTKSGKGELVLSGTSLFEGPMSLSEGAVAFNGVFPGSVTAAPGASIKGTGIIGGAVVVENGATIAPGNSIGSLTVGSLTLDTASITDMEFNNTSSSRVEVAGVAELAGTLNLIQQTDRYDDIGSYTIVSTGSKTGEFSTITGKLFGFTYELDYVGNDVILSYVQATINEQGLTGNIGKFGSYLNDFAPRSYEYYVLAMLSGDELKDALNSVSPARNAFGPFVTQQTVFSLSSTVSTYLNKKRFAATHNIPQEVADLLEPAAYKDGEKYNVWVKGFVDIAEQSAGSQNVAFNFISEGVLFGVDAGGDPDYDLGWVFALAFSQVQDGGSKGSSDIIYGALSLYGAYYWENFYVNGALWGVYHQIKNRREISYSSINTKATATIDGWQVDPHMEMGYIKKYEATEVCPYVSFDCVVNWEGSYTETGAGNWNMHSKAQVSSMLQSEIGMKFFQRKNRFGFKEGASYINRAAFGTGTVTTAIFGAIDFVTLRSFEGAQNLAAVEFLFFAEFGKDRSAILSLGYEGQFGAEYISNEVMLTISKSF